MVTLDRLVNVLGSYGVRLQLTRGEPQTALAADGTVAVLTVDPEVSFSELAAVVYGLVLEGRETELGRGPPTCSPWPTASPTTSAVRSPSRTGGPGCWPTPGCSSRPIRPEPKPSSRGRCRIGCGHCSTPTSADLERQVESDLVLRLLDSTPDAAAEALGVHENTVRYRLRKMAAVVTLDLQDARKRLAMMIELAATEEP